MTTEEMLDLTGFQKVKVGKKIIGRGTLLGFPAEAEVKKQELILYLFVDTRLPGRQIRALRRRLYETEGLEGKAIVLGVSSDPGIRVPGSFFSVDIALKNEEPQTLYSRTIRALEIAVREEGIKPPNTCSFCKRVGGDALMRCDARLRLVHMYCLRSWQETEKEKIEQKSFIAGYLQGMVGGLLGGIVGSVPALAALYFLEYLPGFFDNAIWLRMFIPGGAYFGWKLFGGRLNRITIIFVVLYALVLATAINFAETFFLPHSAFPAPIALQDAIGLYLTSEYLSWAIVPILASVALGIFVAWKEIFRTDKRIMADNQAVYDDATPLG